MLKNAKHAALQQATQSVTNSSDGASRGNTQSSESLLIHDGGVDAEHLVHVQNAIENAL